MYYSVVDPVYTCLSDKVGTICGGEDWNQLAQFVMDSWRYDRFCMSNLTVSTEHLNCEYYVLLGLVLLLLVLVQFLPVLLSPVIDRNIFCWL